MIKKIINIVGKSIGVILLLWFGQFLLDVPIVTATMDHVYHGIGIALIMLAGFIGKSIAER